MFCVIINMIFCLELQPLPIVYKNNLESESLKSLYQSLSYVKLQINIEFCFYLCIFLLKDKEFNIDD